MDDKCAKVPSSHGVIQGYNGIAGVDDKHQVIVHGRRSGLARKLICGARCCSILGRISPQSARRVTSWARRSCSQTTATIAFGVGGGAFAGPIPVALSCCDIYGNAGGDWVGEISGQLGMNGNICEDPLLCAPESGDFSLHEASPCGPLQRTECGLMGAWGIGWGGLATVGDPDAVPITWGWIRARFGQLGTR